MNRFYRDYSRRSRFCVYCGEPATTKDHILALSKFTLVYPEGLYIVPCCFQCNAFAGGRLFHNIREKQEFIKARIRKRYQWIMTEEPRRKGWYESLIPIMKRRLAWPDVINVEIALPKPANGSGFARPSVATLFTRPAPVWHDEAFILDPDFDEMSDWYG